MLAAEGFVVVFAHSARVMRSKKWPVADTSRSGTLGQEGLPVRRIVVKCRPMPI